MRSNRTKDVCCVKHSGHAYITMSIILPITYISRILMTNILTTNNPILINLLSLDSSYLDESNGSTFIKFESLNAEIFLILHFYYELSYRPIGLAKVIIHNKSAKSRIS